MKKQKKNTSTLEKKIKAIKKDVLGQDEVIEQVCSLIDMGKKRWSSINNYELEPSLTPPFCSALLIGTSGCGKTYTLKNIAKQEDMIFYEIDATTLTAEGWKGSSLSAHWKSLSEKMEKTDDKLALVLIDEIDKILKYEEHEGNAKYDLLKPLEGGVWTAEHDNTLFNFNFDKCVIIMSGAFTGIEKLHTNKKSNIGFNSLQKVKNDNRGDVSREDLIKWGAPRELVGRFSLILNLNELNQQDYKQITKYKITKKYSSLFPNFELKIDNSASDYLAKKAVDNKLGARFIDQSINDLLTKKVWMDVNSSDQDTENGIINITLDGNDLEFKIKKSKHNVQKQEIKKIEDSEDKKIWSKVILDNIVINDLWIEARTSKECLSENIFEYMSTIKHQEMNLYTGDIAGEIINEYSSAELDLLFSIICFLKYYQEESSFNFDNLKKLLKKHPINCYGNKPIVNCLSGEYLYRNSREDENVPVKVNKIKDIKNNAKDTSGQYTNNYSKSICNLIKETTLMKNAYYEFMSLPLKERDEAIKMLCWRLI